MNHCIYCLKKDSEVIFESREHVIPQSFGTFTLDNLVIDGYVCDSCNSTFSLFETHFLEDTLEGFTAQRLNFQQRNSITLRNNNFKVSRESGLGDEFFNKMVFVLKPENKKARAFPKTQVQIKGLNGIYCRIFFPEALKEIKKDSKRFKKISNDMKKLSQKDIHVFAETEGEMEEVISLLKDFGLPYKEKERKYLNFNDNPRPILKENYTCSINQDTGRVLAKIAFNYFAFSCDRDNKRDVLFLENFNPIREYIHAGKGRMKDFIVSVEEEPILYNERDGHSRNVAHMINFTEEDGLIVARMTLLGCPAIYKIVIGKIPKEIASSNFGCGHLFEPFSKTIQNIYNLPIAGTPTEEQLKLKFGINNRFCK